MISITLKSALGASAIGVASKVRQLPPNYLLVFLFAFSFCLKGKYYKRYTHISSVGLRSQLEKIYGIVLSRQVVTRAMNKCIKLKLLERTTATFATTSNTGKKLPVKTSYYRLAAL